MLDLPAAYLLQIVDPVLLRFHTGGPLAAIGLVAAIIIVLQILAIISVVRGRLSLMAKILWILAIVFFNIFGVILYFLLGRTRR